MGNLLLPPQDLEQLERNRVITKKERDGLETRTLTVPANLPPVAAPKLEAACREGALSRKECSSGLLQPSRSRQRTVRVRMNGRETTDALATGTVRAKPLTVPVTSLNAGSNASFRLESVFAVTPRPLGSAGQRRSQSSVPCAGSGLHQQWFRLASASGAGHLASACRS